MMTAVVIYITLFRNAAGYQILNVNTGFFRKSSRDTLHHEHKGTQHYPVLHSSSSSHKLSVSDTVVCQKLS